MSIGFSRQEDWSWLPFPIPWYIPNLGIATTPPGKSLYFYIKLSDCFFFIYPYFISGYFASYFYVFLRNIIFSSVSWWSFNPLILNSFLYSLHFYFTFIFYGVNYYPNCRYYWLSFLVLVLDVCFVISKLFYNSFQAYEK